MWVRPSWGGSAWRGMLLVVFYCLGLGLPFLLLSIGLGWAATTVGFLRRHMVFWERILAVGVAAMLFLNYSWTDEAGFALAAVLYGLHWWRTRARLRVATLRGPFPIPTVGVETLDDAFARGALGPRCLVVAHRRMLPVGRHGARSIDREGGMRALICPGSERRCPEERRGGGGGSSPPPAAGSPPRPVPGNG